MATPCAGCGKPANTTFSAVEANPYPLFIKAGSHLSHAEGFSGAKVSALISATECAIAMPEHAWQAEAPTVTMGKISSFFFLCRTVL